jgi:hypothetical protein
MDALPLSLNRDQLTLICESVEQMMTHLQAQQFSSDDRSQKEQNLLTYGTDEYPEAQARTQAIEEQLKQQLESWDSPPDDSKPVPLALDPYQLKILQMGIEHQIDTLDDRAKQDLLCDVMRQLPEYNLQEDAD